MVEQRRYFGSRGPIDRFEEQLIRPRERGYAFGRSARREREVEEPTPLFLAEAEDDPEAEEFDDEGEGYAQDRQKYDNPLRRFRGSNFSFRVLMAVLGASAVAMLFALFSSDSARDLFETARVSIASALPVPTASAQPEASTGLTARDLQLRPADQAGTANLPKVAMAPTREDISSAYQNALQNRAVAPPPPVAVSTPDVIAPTFVTPTAPQPVLAAPSTAPPPPVAVAPAAAMPMAVAPPPPVTPAAPAAARRIDADELASLMKRARELLATGDIPSARLLLRRAAGAPDVSAAFLLAQTYDAGMLGTRDVRNVTPDMATARAWYEKAAALGSTDAQRRLAQMQN